MDPFIGGARPIANRYLECRPSACRARGPRHVAPAVQVLEEAPQVELRGVMHGMHGRHSGFAFDTYGWRR